MIRKTISAIALIGLFWIAPPLTFVSTDSRIGVAAAQTAAPNGFDMTSWMAMPGTQGMSGATPQFNLATPGGWTMFMRPSTYTSFMNPATYGQFMSPQFYLQFANPNNWMSWMNPAAYGPWMNPGTYMQWMNPAEYMALMNPGSYMQWMNPASYSMYMNPTTYMQWMNPAGYASPQGAGAQAYGAAPTYNWFDPNSWAAKMPPGQTAVPGQPGAQGQAMFNPFDPATWMGSAQPAEPSASGQ